MEYCIYCYSNRCDSHCCETIDGTLNDAISAFASRFDNDYSVDSERVTVENHDEMYPCLCYTDYDGDGGYWRYQMVLWPSIVEDS